MNKIVSKKNIVSLQDGIIVKEFSNAAFCDNEESILKTLNGINAPKLILRKDNIIYMENIEGVLLVDEYVYCSIAKGKMLGSKLAAAVKAIYAIIGKITYDENFRNYILRNGEIVRVDFEEVTEGTLESWCAKIFAFASLYDTPDTSKLVFMNTLANELDVNKNMLCTEYKTELAFLSKRWKVPFPTHFFEILTKNIW